MKHDFSVRFVCISIISFNLINRSLRSLADNLEDDDCDYGKHDHNYQADHETVGVYLAGEVSKVGFGST